MIPTPRLSPAERFAGIVATLLAMVGARLERPGKPGLAGPLTLAIAIRLGRIRNRLTRYAVRWQAGTLTPPRRRPATPRRRRPPGPGQWDHLPKLPRGRLWLVRLVPGSGVGATYLRILLDDPEMQAMLRAAPQIGRTLRPFWHMLSSGPLPPLLQRPAAPPPPPAEAAAPPLADPPCADPPCADPPRAEAPCPAPPRQHRPPATERAAPNACGPPVPA